MKLSTLKYSFILIGLFLLCSVTSHAQYFLTGQDPASVKWNQIKTDHFQIIFPREYSKMAQYYINLMSLTSPYVGQPYLKENQQKRLSIVLHNRSTTSNAMVSIAPMRAEYFETPPQSSYPQIWQDQLALHEYRHAVHMYTLRQGLTKGLYYVFGEQGVAAVMGLWLPFWFMEGDAVYSETLYSSSGRGRTPDFIYPLKAQLLNKKIYKYDKAVFGSYKNFVPNHYELGYQLVTKGVQQYGEEMWQFTIDRVARRPYYLVPFTTAIKKQTGKFKVQYYNATLKSLRNEWWLNDQKSIDDQIEIITPENRFFTDYLFPNVLDDGSVIAEKTGLDDINRFVLITADGEEQRIFTPGYDFKESLSVSGNVICWNERNYDPRWDMRNYSVIKLYDFEQKRLRKLTTKSRYFAPSLSDDGQFIVAVEVTTNSRYALHILDTETGDLVKEINTSENLLFLTPKWSYDDQYIVATVLGKDGKSIVLINTDNWELEYLLPFSFKEIKRPVMHGEWVVYTGTYEGKDMLYALNASSGNVFRVFEPRFGANNVAFSKTGEELVFSYYTADGNKLATIPFQPQHFDSINLAKTHYKYLIDKLKKPSTFNLDETAVPTEVYPENKYKKGGHLFNLHSWAPLAVDVNNYTVQPGVTLLSQNVLSTSVATLSWEYDPNELTHKIKFGYDYYGWYPIIGLSVDYGGRRVTHGTGDDQVELRWKETNLTLNVSVPLNFTNSKWVKGLRPSVGIDQKFLNMDPASGFEFKEDQVTVPNYRLYAYNQYKMSPKDIYPHWGQSIDLLYRHTPLSDSISSQLGLAGWLYFPGFVRHQGFRIYGGYQKTETGGYSFSNFVSIPRGYSNVSYPEYFTIRSDFAFPIAYPDLNVPGFFYLKRIYSKLFYDYMQGYENDQIYDLSSAGVELYTDWNFLSILINFRLGVRASHRFEDGTQRYEFLFGLSLN